MNSAVAGAPSFYDVVVIGLGPTGATLANLLGLWGVNVLVLEKESAVYPLPRAVHFDDEVMRVFQSIGLADDISLITRVNVGMRFVDRHGQVLLDWPRPQEIGPNGWYASYRFHQPDLEGILRSGLSRFANVEIKSNAKVTSCEETESHVVIRYDDLVGGNSHAVSARYVVGCDGANSIVRQFMATEIDDLGFKERWLVVDVMLKAPRDDLGDYTVQYCLPERPCTYARSPGDRRRWEFTILDHEIADEVSVPQHVWRLLEDWITPEDAELERTAVYTFRSQVARQWRKGRRLIAGDAAHLTPPFMGQGMCAGIRDVSNLAWKLVSALKVPHDDKILNSYQSEREPHARAYIETAIDLGGLINSLDSEAALKAAFEQPDGTIRMNSIAPPLGEGLGIDGPDFERRLFPQWRLGNGQWLDDAIGYNFALLIDTTTLPLGEEDRATIDRRSVKVITPADDPNLADKLAAFSGHAVLLRPDRYILGIAHDRKTLGKLLDSLPP